MKKGFLWLAQKQDECCAEQIVYSRGETQTTVPAVFAQTKYQTTNDYGQTTGAFLFDFLVRFSELGFYPEIGDRITAGGREYEVLELGDEGVWRWSDPYGIRMRIHTKLIKEDK